jgi:cell wall-associated NlpC family hydrolase
MKLLTLFLILFLGTALLASADAAEYATAHTSTPVLNSPYFTAIFGGTGGDKLKVDTCGRVRELEYIALPGTLFRIIKILHSGVAEIYQVETDEYKASPNVLLYVDSRFLKIEKGEASARKRSLPPQDTIVSVLKSSVGNPYIWGGNIPNGVPELAAWFYQGIKDEDRLRLTLAGVDCSGLLYFATDGWTPRNSNQLINYGQAVTIAGKQSSEIAALLQPLDLIVWNGHVIIVLDRQTAIESRLECGKKGNGGVVLTPLTRRIAEIMHSRSPSNSWTGTIKRNDIFVIRRWFPQAKVAFQNLLSQPLKNN